MPDILHRVGINAKPAQVFAALSTIEGIRQWWIVETTGDARLGGLIDFGFTGMKVVASRPGKLVRWKCVRGPKEWLGTEVTFQLKWEDKQRPGDLPASSILPLPRRSNFFVLQIHKNYAHDGFGRKFVADFVSFRHSNFAAFVVFIRQTALSDAPFLPLRRRSRRRPPVLR